MKKLISIFLLTIMCFFMTDSLTGLRVDAAEKAEQSGVEISIASDQDEYAAAEDAQISFSIRNTNMNLVIRLLIITKGKPMVSARGS